MKEERKEVVILNLLAVLGPEPGIVQLYISRSRSSHHLLACHAISQLKKL